MHNKAVLINQTNIRRWAFEGLNHETPAAVLHTSDATHTGTGIAGPTVCPPGDVVAVEVTRVDMLERQGNTQRHNISCVPKFSMLRSRFD